MALAVEAGFTSARPGGDLLSYWLAVLARPVAPVASHAFFAPLTLIPERRDAAAAADVVVASREPGLDAILRRALGEAGLQLVDRPSGPRPEDYEQHASVPAVEALLTSGCVAALTFDGDSEVLPRVAIDGACAGLAKNDRIETLAGIPLGPKGASAWDAGYASCQGRHAGRRRCPWHHGDRPLRPGGPRPPRILRHPGRAVASAPRPYDASTIARPASVPCRTQSGMPTPS